jgi:hypothetical protein
MTHLAPVAPPVSVPSRDLAPAILTVAEALQPDLAQGFQIDALRLRLEMERAFGGSDATGDWDWKLAYEAGEVALVLFLRKFGRALLARAGSPAALMPILAKVAGLLPTHTRRSEEMERFQQFSTPLPMGLAALAAARFASATQIKIAALRKKREYDSSDGLAIWLHTARAVSEPRITPPVRDIWHQILNAGTNADSMAQDLLQDAGLPYDQTRRVPTGFGVDDQSLPG